jgi:hypothetical protein
MRQLIGGCTELRVERRSLRGRLGLKRRTPESRRTCLILTPFSRPWRNGHTDCFIIPANDFSGASSGWLLSLASIHPGG